MSPDRGIAGITRGLEGTNTGESPPEEASPGKPRPGEGRKRRGTGGRDDESINWIP